MERVIFTQLTKTTVGHTLVQCNR